MGATAQIDEGVGRRLGLGWLPDLPDPRDLTLEDDAVKSLLGQTSVPGLDPASLAASVDLRPWCSPIENQGHLGSCTAHAGVGIIEYLERRAYGTYIDASRRFLYKVTRKLAGLTGDSGAHLRNTMGAMRLFGVPPESYWTYIEAQFDEEPPAFCYAFGQNYQAVTYYRLDPPGTDRKALLASIKEHNASQLPAMFGFTAYPTIFAAPEGKIPLPRKGEKPAGGHAVMAVGYDDGIEISNHETVSRGALRIRNSWGTGWGEKGFGWLPYDYVLNNLAVDWWVLLKEEWVSTGEFAT